MGRTFIQLLVLIAALPAVCSAEVYRWIDDNGVVNYTERVPPGVPAERIDARIAQRPGGPEASSTSLPAPTRDDRSTADLDSRGATNSELSPAAQARLEQLRRQEQQRQHEIARIRAGNCSRSTAVLERLTTSGRIREVGPDGVARTIPADEHQRRIAAAQRAIARNCAET